MFEVSRRLSPTTFAAAGLTALAFAGGTALPAGTAPENREQITPKYAPQSTDQTAGLIGWSWTSKVIPIAFADPYREMLSFKKLVDGWDGFGSERLFESSVNAALAFLEMLPQDVPAPVASASGDGTVDWFWRNGQHAATVTFHKNGKVAYFVLSGEGPEKDSFVLTNAIPPKLVESLRRL
jgi:hypothetical protein